MKSTSFCIAATLAIAASAVQADAVFHHPATGGAAVAGSTQAAQARPYIVGHPSSPHWKLVHANFEHPALAVRELPVIDVNTFLVQPPAAVHWTLGPAPVAMVAVAPR